VKYAAWLWLAFVALTASAHAGVHDCDYTKAQPADVTDFVFRDTLCSYPDIRNIAKPNRDLKCASRGKDRSLLAAKYRDKPWLVSEIEETCNRKIAFFGITEYK
jgi:hypothetical protein